MYAEMVPAVNRTVIFDFEREFYEPSFKTWLDVNWISVCTYSAAAYLILIFGIKAYMENRPRFELRTILTIWNTILAVFSIAGAIRTIPELFSAISKHGLQYSACVPSFFVDPVAAFWSCMFTVSKVYELGDTVFIVLRKQQLIFLHWYHHITVLFYAWYSYSDHTAPGRWFMVMNYTVHAFMYTYYALRAMKFKVPRIVNISITTMQLLQMIIGCALNIWIYNIKQRGEFCHMSDGNLQYGFIMYFSYFVLFAHFFYTTYIVKKPVSDVRKTQ